MDYLACYLKGLPLTTILAEVGAISSERSREIPAVADHDRNTHHLVPPIASLAAQLDIAIGLALAVKAKNEGGLVMALCAASQAPAARLRPSLQFAALYRLPIIFLMQSRHSTKLQPSKPGFTSTLTAHADACGIPVIPVDRTDLVAMYRVAFESIQRARHDGGPTVIEPAIWCLPGKHHVHEVDPMDQMEEYLTGKGLFSARWKQNVVRRFNSEVEAAEKRISPERRIRLKCRVEGRSRTLPSGCWISSATGHVIFSRGAFERS